MVNKFGDSVDPIEIRAQVAPLAEDRRERLRGRGVLFDDDAAEPDPVRAELRAKLRSIAGHGAVVLPGDDAVLGPVLARGQLLSGGKARLKPGFPRECHSNAARLWFDGPKKLSLMTGYYMWNDGIWRGHSWCLDRKGRVIETTVIPLLYFGFVLDERESLRMFINESMTHPHRFPDPEAAFANRPEMMALLQDLLDEDPALDEERSAG